MGFNVLEMSLPVAPAPPLGKRGRPVAPNRLQRPPSPALIVDSNETTELSAEDITPEDLQYGASIGTGSTAEVFRGFWKGRDVAIKEVHLQRKSGSQSEIKQQVAFTRELSVLSKVHHPNLVRFYGVCLDVRPLRVITEFCEGECAFQLLHEQDVDLEWSQSLKMCDDVAQGMHYLHNFKPQIIHRDLKSLNLLLARKVTSRKDIPHVKVSDFGTARTKDLDAEWEKLTKAAGTCHWMAPEVLEGNYNHKADIYSYAMVLFEIIGREVPFEDAEGSEVLRLTASGERPDLEAIPPDCPGDLKELMIKCWAHKPEDRPETKDIIDVLDRIIADCGPE